jgi:hypothetical protein
MKPLRSPLFLALTGCHALAALFPPTVLAPAIAGSIYIPLLPLKAIGVPVFGTAQSGGWSSPSLIGWVVVIILWLVIWWAVAYLVSRLFSRLGS